VAHGEQDHELQAQLEEDLQPEHAGGGVVEALLDRAQVRDGEDQRRWPRDQTPRPTQDREADRAVNPERCPSLA